MVDITNVIPVNQFSAIAQSQAILAVQNSPFGAAAGIIDRLLTNAAGGLFNSGIATVRTFGQGTGFTFQAMVTEREQHRDEMVITEHPVATGAPITDHSYVRPAELSLEVGWSDSGGFQPGVSRAMYAALIACRNTRKLMQVVTGKRTYSGMLIASIDEQTDEATEYALRVTLHLRQVILTSTQSFNSGASSDPANQSDPGSTQAPSDQGSVQQKASTNFTAGDVSGTALVSDSGITASGSISGAQPGISVEPTVILQDDPASVVHLAPSEIPLATAPPAATSDVFQRPF